MRQALRGRAQRRDRSRSTATVCSRATSRSSPTPCDATVRAALRRRPGPDLQHRRWRPRPRWPRSSTRSSGWPGAGCTLERRGRAAGRRAANRRRHDGRPRRPRLAATGRPSTTGWRPSWPGCGRPTPDEAGRMTVRLAVVTSGFPRISETFALNELVALQASRPAGRRSSPPSPVTGRRCSRRSRSCGRCVTQLPDRRRRRAGGALWSARSAARGSSAVHGYFAHAARRGRRRALPSCSASRSASARTPLDVRSTPPSGPGGAGACGRRCLDLQQRDRRRSCAARASSPAVLPHGVDLSRFAPVATRVPRGRPARACGCSAVGPAGGEEGLRRAAAGAVAGSTASRVRLLGVGTAGGVALRAQAAEAGRPRRVGRACAPTPSCPPSTQRRTSSSCPAWWTQSGDRDGLPNVLLEAMASGAAGGRQRRGGGRATRSCDGEHRAAGPAGRPGALAEALRRLRDDAALRAALGAAARQHVVERYDLGPLHRSGCCRAAGGELWLSRARRDLGPEVAYVLKGFPRISETFIASEIHRVEQLGVPLRLFVLKPPDEPERHPVVDRIAAVPEYLPATTSLSATPALALAGAQPAAVPARPASRSPRRRPAGLARAAGQAPPRRCGLAGGRFGAAAHDLPQGVPATRSRWRTGCDRPAGASPARPLRARLHHRRLARRDHHRAAVLVHRARQGHLRRGAQPRRTAGAQDARRGVRRDMHAGQRAAPGGAGHRDAGARRLPRSGRRLHRPGRRGRDPRDGHGGPTAAACSASAGWSPKKGFDTFVDACARAARLRGRASRPTSPVSRGEHGAGGPRRWSTSSGSSDQVHLLGTRTPGRAATSCTAGRACSPSPAG